MATKVIYQLNKLVLKHLNFIVEYITTIESAFLRNNVVEVKH